MKSKVFFFFFFLVISNLAIAQDMIYSQFYANKIFFNPAYAGFSDLRANLAYREMWTSVPGNLRNLNFAIDGAIPEYNMGYAVMVNKDERGEGILTTTEPSFILSHRLILKEKKYNHFRISWNNGLQSSIVFKGINWDRLEFSDQFDPVLGKVYSSNAIPPQNQQFNFLDFTGGSLLRFESKKNDQRIGFSVKHLTSPSESFYSLPQKIYRLWTFHYEANFLMPNKSIILSPAFIYGIQSSTRTLNIGSNLNYNNIIFGLWYRNRSFFLNVLNSDAIIPSFAIMRKVVDYSYSWMLGYSYDAPISALGFNTFGTHEFNLSIDFDCSRYRNLRAKKQKAKKQMRCKNYNGIYRAFNNQGEFIYQQYRDKRR